MRDLLFELKVAGFALLAVAKKRVALINKSSEPLARLFGFFGQTQFEGCGVGQAFRHGGEFFAAAGEFALLGLRLSAENGQTFGGSSGFLLGVCTRQQRLLAGPMRVGGAQAGVLGFGCQA